MPLLVIGTILAVFVLAIFSLVVALRLQIKWSKLFGKKSVTNGKLLEDILQRISKNETRLDSAETRIDLAEKISKISVQKVGFLRFNPFRDMGGDQSFSVALLDYQDNGVIISSLHTREGTRVYAKEISNGKPKQPLSKEEETVLDKAFGK